jgi:hypothetical protein
MNHSFSKFKKQAYPTLKYANFLTHMLTDKYNDWETNIINRYIGRPNRYILYNLEEFIGFENLLEEFEAHIMGSLPTIWSEEDIGELGVWYSKEYELEYREENNDENYCGLINIHVLRQMLYDMDLNNIDREEYIEGKDPIKIFNDIQKIVSVKARDNWYDMMEYQFQELSAFPFGVYLFKLGHLILDEMEDRQIKYINKLKKDKATFIADKYLEAKYSPYTKLGKDRFDKERNSLFV